MFHRSWMRWFEFTPYSSWTMYKPKNFPVPQYVNIFSIRFIVRGISFPHRTDLWTQVDFSVGVTILALEFALWWYIKLVSEVDISKCPWSKTEESWGWRNHKITMQLWYERKGGKKRRKVLDLSVLMRESIPRQVKSGSRAHKEMGVWNSQGGGKDKLFFYIHS